MQRQSLPAQQPPPRRRQPGGPEVRVPLPDLLTDGFLKRHTLFTSLESFFTAGRLNPADLARLDPRTARRWDQFVRGTSTYADWQEMLREAGAEWMIRRLGVFIEV